ncbi:DUF2188 domain-containing protein [Bacillus sp. NP157]|nr:DUF2188 domain-containing protein [Bacillus sp. NP157]
MTRIYEVPYRSEDGLGWPVRVDGRIMARYDSRYDALAAAVNKAAADGGDSSIGIEGADGVWRPFGSDAKRPARVPAMPARRFSVVR